MLLDFDSSEFVGAVQIYEVLKGFYLTEAKLLI